MSKISSRFSSTRVMAYKLKVPPKYLTCSQNDLLKLYEEDDEEDEEDDEEELYQHIQLQLELINTLQEQPWSMEKKLETLR